jgi:hypothetical protein
MKDGEGVSDDQERTGRAIDRCAQQLSTSDKQRAMGDWTDSRASDDLLACKVGVRFILYNGF